MDIGIYNYSDYYTVITTDKALAQNILDLYSSAMCITFHDKSEKMDVYNITYRKDERR